MSEALFNNPKGYVCGYCAKWFKTVKEIAVHWCKQSLEAKKK